MHIVRLVILTYWKKLQCAFPLSVTNIEFVHVYWVRIYPFIKADLCELVYTWFQLWCFLYNAIAIICSLLYMIRNDFGFSFRRNPITGMFCCLIWNDDIYLPGELSVYWRKFHQPWKKRFLYILEPVRAHQVKLRCALEPFPSSVSEFTRSC